MTVEPDRVTAHTEITTHTTDGLALFFRVFANSPKLQALATAWLDQVQLAENALWDLLVNTAIDTAAGVVLDQIGALLQFARGTIADDATYRAVLKGVVRARRSSGTPEDLIAVCTLVLGVTTFSYSEGFASALVEVHSPPGFDLHALLAALDIAKDGGVQIQVIAPARAESGLFTFADALVAQTDALRGFSDTAQTTGGYLTGAIA